MMHRRKWKNVLMILGTAGVVYVSFYYLLPLVVPFVFAFLFARLVRPLVEWLHRKTHVHENVCSVVVIMLFLGALGSFLFYIGYICLDQLSQLLRRIPANLDVCSRLCRNACGGVDNLLGLSRGDTFLWVESQVTGMGGKISGEILPKVTGYIPGMVKTLGEWGAAFVVFVMATLLISFDRNREIHYRELLPVVQRLKLAGFSYLKAQGILIFIVSALSVIVLLILKNPYAILIGIVIGVVDAFPILGSGTILIPWAVVEFVQHDFVPAAVLLTLYVAAMLLREILEPRLMGKEMGLKPLYVLMSVYVGVQLFGVSGIVLGPIGITILQSVTEMAKKIV